MREQIQAIFAEHGIDFDALTLEEQADYIMRAIGGAYGQDNPLSELAGAEQPVIPGGAADADRAGSRADGRGD